MLKCSISKRQAMHLLSNLPNTHITHASQTAQNPSLAIARAPSRPLIILTIHRISARHIGKLRFLQYTPQLRIPRID